jgi:hypothetical protein
MRDGDVKAWLGWMRGLKSGDEGWVLEPGIRGGIRGR